MTRLPPRPNFEAIDAAAPRSADHRTRILSLIGNLVFAWSNNESLLIYLMMILLRTDQTSAAIIFATLNTTRARLDLIQRLAKAKITDRSLTRDLQQLIERFNECTRIRNEFNHCMYTLDEAGEITGTQAMRLQETRSRIQWGQVRPLNEDRLHDIGAAVNELKRLNRDIWDFFPRLQASLSPSPEAAPRGPAKPRPDGGAGAP